VIRIRFLLIVVTLGHPEAAAAPAGTDAAVVAAQLLVPELPADSDMLEVAILTHWRGSFSNI